MLAQTPINLDKVSDELKDLEILRVGMQAELDAVNLYEQLASLAEKDDIKAILMDIAREEKTHVGEFEALLMKYDAEQVEESRKGKEEVEEMKE